MLTVGNQYQGDPYDVQLQLTSSLATDMECAMEAGFPNSNSR